MIRSYLMIAWRNLLKSKGYSCINIGGLAVGMAAFLLIVHYVRFERSYEDFNPHAKDICRITLDFYKGSEYIVTDCETQAPIGPLLKEKMPEVKNFLRMYSDDGLKEIRARNVNFLQEGIYFADTSVFDMLALQVLHGNPATSLTAPMQAVLTASLAKKYFGTTDVVGETFEKDKELYTITCVIADAPPNTHLKYAVLISHASLLKRSYYAEDNWSGNNEYTYLLMEPGTDLSGFNRKLGALCATLKDKLHDNRYTAEPVTDIHLYSNKTFEPEVNGNAKTVSFLMIIAAFIILIAWINYINLSTARAMERAREVGIRKVMGSARTQLIFQFLSESAIMNGVAGIAACVLFGALLPAFRHLTGQPLSFDLADGSFWYLFIGLLTGGALLSGSYPAFVLSSFQPASVLKGKFRSSSRGQILRKGLVVFQFGTTAVLVISMLTVYLQIRHLRSQDLGMNISQTLIVRSPELDSDSSYRATFENFKTELAHTPEVGTVARSTSLPGLSLNDLSSTHIVRLGEQRREKGFVYYFFGIDADFLSALGMKLVAGRNFESGQPNDDRVIINEEAVHKLGFSSAQEAVGSKITFQTRGDGEPATIIGVIRNFYQRSPKENHIPMLFEPLRGTDFFSIKLNSTDIHHSLSSVQTAYERTFPNTVFSYFFLDEKFNQQFQSDKQFGQVIAVFSGLAVFIACLGLVGLSSYSILQRTKEIGIRKVLGASVTQIVRLLSQDFAKVILVGALMALPAAYWAMEEWLSGYAVRISLNGWVFVLPVLVILLMAWITVSFQIVKTAVTNPVNSLRSE